MSRPSAVTFGGEVGLPHPDVARSEFDQPLFVRLLFTLQGDLPRLVGEFSHGHVPLAQVLAVIVQPGLRKERLASLIVMRHGHERVRSTAVVIAAASSGLVIAVATLPVLPASTLAHTPIPEVYGESAEQVGWPELVAAVRDAAQTLTPEDRARAVVFTANYGEAGAVELLGADLPPVYSGHNAYGDWGPPPEETVVTILVGHFDPTPLEPALGTCAVSGRVDNGIDLRNQAQGAGVWICRDRSRPWEQSWAELRHLD